MYQVVTRLHMWNNIFNTKWNPKQGLLEGTLLLPCTIQVLLNGYHHQGAPLRQATMVTLPPEDTLGTMSLNLTCAIDKNHNIKSTIHMCLLTMNYL